MDGTRVPAWILSGMAVAASLAVLAWSLAARPVIRTLSEGAILRETPDALAVSRWDRDPSVLVLDFPTLEQQGRMLDRVAALIEKRGEPHDRVLDDADLARAIAASGATPATYYYGHDYAASDLARFFALADRDGVRLNAEEERLRRLGRGQGWGAGRAGHGREAGALISIPRAAGPVGAAMRAAILHHELSHGAFFTVADYADWCRRFWLQRLTRPERAGFRSWLASEGYDPAIEETMVNETQAYLIWTPDAEFFRPSLAALDPPRADELRRQFLAGLPADARREQVPLP